MNRELVTTVAGCLAGAGLALYAAQQAWQVTVTPRQPPLSPLRETITGADVAPWLPAAALVGLAAAIALYATRRTGRVLVALVAAVSGLALVTGSAIGVAASPGPWPAACLVGGLLVALAGGYALLRGQDWPSMGARYTAPAAAPEPADTGDDPAALWDALDSGTDPTR